MTSEVTAVSKSDTHSFSKQTCKTITLVAGVGVTGDAHAGATVKHKSRLPQAETEPNLRQVHLLQAELHDELNSAGFSVAAGQLGENVTTRGIDLLGLPTGARLRLGDDAVVEVTGLRNPCSQLDSFQKGLTAAVLDRDADGALIRKAGVMAIVVASGDVHSGDTIQVELPPLPHTPLAPI